jgi:CheY-like chemotaxis protein
MSLHFSLEQMARLRDNARRLESQAAANEEALNALLVSAQVEADRASRLCAAARKHHVAATRLVAELGDRQARPDGERSMRHAVLVVDDYQDSREFMSMVLHNAGFIVRTANNGLEAVIAAYEMQPAVIVMDMIMPVLDGLEATRLIKEIDELRDARIIAYAAQSPIDPNLASGLFSAVLPKPSSPDVVVAAVQRFARV